MLFKTKFYNKKEALEDVKKARKEYPQYKWRLISKQNKTYGKYYILKSTEK